MAGTAVVVKDNDRRPEPKVDATRLASGGFETRDVWNLAAVLEVGPELLEVCE